MVVCGVCLCCFLFEGKNKKVKTQLERIKELEEELRARAIDAESHRVPVVELESTVAAQSDRITALENEKEFWRHSVETLEVADREKRGKSTREVDEKVDYLEAKLQVECDRNEGLVAMLLAANSAKPNINVSDDSMLAMEQSLESCSRRADGLGAKLKQRDAKLLELESELEKRVERSKALVESLKHTTDELQARDEKIGALEAKLKAQGSKIRSLAAELELSLERRSLLEVELEQARSHVQALVQAIETHQSPVQPHGSQRSDIVYMEQRNEAQIAQLESAISSALDSLRRRAAPGTASERQCPLSCLAYRPVAFHAWRIAL